MRKTSPQLRLVTLRDSAIIILMESIVIFFFCSKILPVDVPELPLPDQHKHFNAVTSKSWRRSRQSCGGPGRGGGTAASRRWQELGPAPAPSKASAKPWGAGPTPVPCRHPSCDQLSRFLCAALTLGDWEQENLILKRIQGSGGESLAEAHVCIINAAATPLLAAARLWVQMEAQPLGCRAVTSLRHLSPESPAVIGTTRGRMAAQPQHLNGLWINHQQGSSR